MSRNGKVIVAMSGGVDSSVTACLLKEQGYECVGVFMNVGVTRGVSAGSGTDAACSTAPACCSHDAAGDARAIADRLGIQFHALDFKADFERIITYFLDEYGRARTPNPCIRCNQELKFGKLLRFADSLDAEFIATGHYARIVRNGEAPRLARAANVAKDQSYVLFGIRRADLPRVLLPLGEMPDKSLVRDLAATLGLSVHDKPESQEICFIPDNDYKRLVRERRPESQQSGVVRDVAGNIVGSHEGITSYTIGQRRGLALAMGYPIYVTDLCAATNTVTIGTRAELLRDGLVADGVNWLVDAPTARRAADIKIRYTHTPVAGDITPDADNRVTATFSEPQPAVTPGQAAVFYDEQDVVLGGGWIASAFHQAAM
ncbi:MAG: tRNA 2-thiouridine(34) synthase MnmA [Phycisphaerae bacterium]|nr:tRNA 2-thiouridine(34) synthase MnmA [Phycisphaerae bacterium]